jgi:hypothetical protein
MNEAGECQVEGDKARNLIQIRFRGNISPALMKECSEKVSDLLPQMSRGFILLVDMSNVDSTDLESVPYITKVMDDCKARGVETVVRIIPDPRKDIGLKILSNVHYGRSVKVVTFQNAAEAERMIASLGRRLDSNPSHSAGNE